MTFLAAVGKQTVLAARTYKKSIKLFLAEPEPVCREPICHPETSGLFQHAAASTPKQLRKPYCTDTFPIFL